MNNNGNNSDELLSWIVVAIALIAFWPLGLFLLFRKLFGTSYSEKSSYRQYGNTSYRQTGNSTSYRQTGNSTSYRQSTGNSTYNYSYRQSQKQTQQRADPWANSSERRASDSYVSSRRTSDAYKTASGAASGSAKSGGAKSGGRKNGRNSLSGQFISVCLLILSVLLFFIAAGNILSGLDSVRDLAVGGFFLAGGGAALAFRSLFNRRRKRYSNYFTIIGDKKVMSVKKLAEVTGIPEKTIRKDVQTMVDRDYFGETAYFDVGLDSLVLSTDVAEEERKRRVDADKKAASEAAPTNKYMAILKQLRDLNDSIADPLISEKIDNIEDLSGKIFRLVEAKPEKLPQIRKFMDYYLPSTLKLLSSYATLEHQGIEGENITSAKENIARILDTMTTGYRQQLDALFRDDAIDISADIDVLQMTMERDGLTGAQSPFAAAMKNSKKKKPAAPAQDAAPAAPTVMTSTGETFPATSPSENPFSDPKSGGSGTTSGGN